MIRHVFADVIRINAAITGGNFAVDVPRGSPHTDTGQLYAALRVFRNNVADKATLEANAKSEEADRTSRQQRVENLIEDFRRRVQELLQKVGDNMSQMQETAKLLARSAEDTSARAGNAAGAVAQASMNVQTVASASEELAASISVISRQVNETTNVVTKATEGARSTNDSVATLADTAQKIGEIITLIRAIADQTNLLALNATIEAARAGEMGRGFAVVATEVKSLATQTARATEDITGQIAAIQSSTRQAADAIKLLAATMEEANAYTAVIADSVQKQGSATGEISRNAQQAASETQKVTTNMAGVTAAVGDTMQSAAMVERASADVVDCASELRRAVTLFLEQVAAA
jgi:methyl-accepting chemotaxis protein